MIFLSSPYSDPNPLVMAERYREARELTAAMLRQGAVVFSPIVYLHELAKDYQLPKDAKYWSNFNVSMLRRADVFAILMLDGWEQSKGVQMELSLAKHLNIPVQELRKVD
jgi:hypothetical protein